ncbi:ABC transporter permease [Cohnella endophytica]|uniref:Transport permease protein n=1 Tax=Cohnella endophytica TaxID=2419778 RepID=A0A494XDY8_9BACL|nr:ABC transporter permease [Cohnella endophytica]
MKDMAWLIRKTLTNTFRNKRSWIVYFGLPICGIVLSMLLYGNASNGTLRIGIANHDGDQTLSQDAIRFVQSLNNVKVTMTDDEQALRSDIAAGKLDSGLVIGEGFSDALKNGNPDPEQLTLVSVKGAQVTAYVKALLQGYVGNVAAIGKQTHGDSAAFDAIYAAYAKKPFQFHTEAVKDTSNKKDMTYQSIGYLITFMLFSAANLTELILKEKENRTFLRLMSSPISARSYVLSNVAVNILILLMQIVVALFVMKTVLKVDSGIPFAQMLSLLLLFGLAAIGLSLLIVAFARSSSSASALQNLILTPTCLLSGCFFPANIMPESVNKIASFLPQHWLLDSLQKLQNGEGLGSLGLNVGILFAFAAAFSLIAIYRFARNNDTKSFV